MTASDREELGRMGFEAIPNRGLRTWERYREEVREEWRCAGETLFAAGRTSRDEEVADIGEALEVATNQVARLTRERDDAQRLVGEQREEARAARERLAATCETEGHVLRYRTPWESVCDRCGHVERREPTPVERSHRSRANALAMVAVALAADLAPPERAARKAARS